MASRSGKRAAMSTPTLELARDVPRADAQLETATGEEVDDGRLLGEMERVPDRCQRDRGADPGMPGAGCDRRREHERLGEVAVFEPVVLGEPDAVGAGARRPPPRCRPVARSARARGVASPVGCVRRRRDRSGARKRSSARRNSNPGTDGVVRKRCPQRVSGSAADDRFHRPRAHRTHEGGVARAECDLGPERELLLRREHEVVAARTDDPETGRRVEVERVGVLVAEPSSECHPWYRRRHIVSRSHIDRRRERAPRPTCTPHVSRLVLRLDHFCEDRCRVLMEAGDGRAVERVPAEQDCFPESEVVDPAESARSRRNHSRVDELPPDTTPSARPNCASIDVARSESSPMLGSSGTTPLRQARFVPMPWSSMFGNARHRVTASGRSAGMMPSRRSPARP